MSGIDALGWSRSDVALNLGFWRPDCHRDEAYPTGDLTKLRPESWNDHPKLPLGTSYRLSALDKVIGATPNKTDIAVIVSEPDATAWAA